MVADVMTHFWSVTDVLWVVHDVSEASEVGHDVSDVPKVVHDVSSLLVVLLFVMSDVTYNDRCMVICYQRLSSNIKNGGTLEIKIKINPLAQEISPSS